MIEDLAHKMLFKVRNFDFTYKNPKGFYKLNSDEKKSVVHFATVRAFELTKIV